MQLSTDSSVIICDDLPSDSETASLQPGRPEQPAVQAILLGPKAISLFSAWLRILHSGSGQPRPAWRDMAGRIKLAERCGSKSQARLIQPPVAKAGFFVPLVIQ